MLLIILVVVGLLIVLAKIASSRAKVDLYVSTGIGKDLNRKIDVIVKSVGYYPSPYCFIDNKGLLQTSCHAILRNITHLVKKYAFKKDLIKYKREKVVMEDGGTVALDWAYRAIPRSTEVLDDNSPVVILNHGMAGSSKSEYIVHFASVLMASGYRVGALVARGCGGLQFTAGPVFAGRKTSDIHECVMLIRKRYPHAQIFWVGYSLGAAMALQYIARYDSEINPKGTGPKGLSAVVSISPPWSMNNNVLSPTSSDLWSHVLSIPLKIYIMKHYSYLKAREGQRPFSKWEIFTASDMIKLDQELTKVYGDSYGSLDNYYKPRETSPVLSAHMIHTPTLVVSAIDDPICNHNDSPTEGKDIGPGLVVLKTKYGGHVAFPEGWLPLTTSYVDRLTLAWFDSFREDKKRQ